VAIPLQPVSAITIDGVSYPAEPVADGAAYEVFSEVAAPGFLRLTHPGRFLITGSCRPEPTASRPCCTHRCAGA
jgi:hypothetical protein